MDLSIRKLKSSDYDILQGWWKDWGWDPVPKDFLPDNGTGGLMILIDGSPVAAGFIYKTNSKVFWIDFIVSTKERIEGRSKAINVLLYALDDSCKKMGAKYIYALIKNISLIGRYEALGFKKSGQYTTEMIKSL